MRTIFGAVLAMGLCIAANGASAATRYTLVLQVGFSTNVPSLTTLPESYATKAACVAAGELFRRGEATVYSSRYFCLPSP
jgi:hypothetical protein